MITNELLEEKYKTQKKLDEDADHNLEKYIENTYKITQEFEKNTGHKFKYGNAVSCVK